MMDIVNRCFPVIAAGVLALSLSACAEDSSPVPAGSSSAADAVTKLTDAAASMQVFKQKSCGCCGKWVDHVSQAGFPVAVQDRQDMAAIKTEYSIAPQYQSCHTGVVGDYVFEGHVPASLIQQFLAEQPADSIGLAVPGMPVGSPGMEMGDRIDSYDVLLLKTDGSSEVYAHVDESGEISRQGHHAP